MLHLLLVIHNHQPLGNLPEVYRKAYDQAYGPFLDVVRKHPRIKWALHTSGCLWEWLETEEPSYLDALRQEHTAGRLEFLTGAMWEPVQPLINSAAFHHQFKLMNKFLEDRFAVEPVGSWTTERVWEPALASRLSEAGIRYTLLDDSQLRAGLPGPADHRVWGYYRTEHNGRSIAIFPINEKLRYMIPFRKADEVVAHIENLAGELPDGAAITYGDDGEKFGLWPETFKWVFEKGWLDEFLGRIEESSVIVTTHPSDYLQLTPHPRKRVYIPTSSYREMGIWNLYPDRNLAAEGIYKWVESNWELKKVEPPHVSGLFRNFLARYPESRFMHERVHEIIKLVLEKDPEAVPSIDKNASPTSRALWHALRAQCNCTYWHGVFGGLYLNYLRFAVHREVLSAEKELKKSPRSSAKVRYIGTYHTDKRDSKENPDSECSVLVSTDHIQWVVDPVTGQVISAGSVDCLVDVIDVLARRFEAYHATMREASEGQDLDEPASIHDISEIAPPGWREGYGYDLTRRGCFTDRILPKTPTLDELARVDYSQEVGPDSGFWSTEVDGNQVRLINTYGPWKREKVFSFNDAEGSCSMEYKFSRNDGQSFDGWLVFEFNLGLLAGNAPDRFHLLKDGAKLPLDETFERNGLNTAVCVDEWTGVKVSISVPGSHWMGIYPVKTLSRGEGGLEMNYQGTSINFRLPVSITSENVQYNVLKMQVSFKSD